MSGSRTDAMNDADFSDLTSAGPILVYDGVCVLCTGFAAYVLKHDRSKRIRFASAQGETGQAVYRRLGLNTVEFETNVLLDEGKAFVRSDAFIEVMSLLGSPHSLLACMRFLPRLLRDTIYRPIARNRYRIFGQRDACHVPSPRERSRFLA